ncbi:hypothetical protein Trydic_g16789 [Trypoxylus dichotomus]
MCRWRRNIATSRTESKLSVWRAGNGAPRTRNADGRPSVCSTPAHLAALSATFANYKRGSFANIPGRSDEQMTEAVYCAKRPNSRSNGPLTCDQN